MIKVSFQYYGKCVYFIVNISINMFTFMGSANITNFIKMPRNYIIIYFPLNMITINDIVSTY